MVSLLELKIKNFSGFLKVTHLDCKKGKFTRWTKSEVGIVSHSTLILLLEGKILVQPINYT